jgi:hypothetical protein
MTTFTLILTLIVFNGSYSSVSTSVEAIQGFSSEATCAKASDLWLSKVSSKFLKKGSNAICVEN